MVNGRGKEGDNPLFRISGDREEIARIPMERKGFIRLLIQFTELSRFDKIGDLIIGKASFEESMNIKVMAPKQKLVDGFHVDILTNVYILFKV